MFITDLVYVNGCNPSRVTLQGEEAARVLQSINLTNIQQRENLLGLDTDRNNTVCLLVLTLFISVLFVHLNLLCMSTPRDFKHMNETTAVKQKKHMLYLH